MAANNKKDTIQKVILITVFYLILFTLINNTLILKLKTITDKNNMIINDLNAEYQINLINSVNIVEMVDTISEKEVKLFEFEKQLISEFDKKYVIEKITEISKKNNLIIKSINYSDGEDTDFDIFRIQMNIEASFTNFISFLNNINMINKKLLIEKLDIKRTEFNIDINITIAGYIYKEIITDETQEDNDDEVHYYD